MPVYIDIDANIFCQMLLHIFPKPMIKNVVLLTILVINDYFKIFINNR